MFKVADVRHDHVKVVAKLSYLKENNLELGKSILNRRP